MADNPLTFSACGRIIALRRYAKQKRRKKMKKIIAIMLVLVMLFTLASCGLSRKPEDMKEKLEKKYGDDIGVVLIDSSVTIKATAALLGLDSDDVDAILTVALKDAGRGTVIYFESAKAAKEAKKDLVDSLDDDSDVIVKISGKTVFIGEKDLWKKVKGV